MAIVGIIIFSVVLSSALVFLIKLRISISSGKYSERLVHQEISKLPEEYFIFSDLLFEGNERSTQIDHIIVSPYGIFVIETKGLSGCILGGEYAQYWTQITSRNRYRFHNPIKQNESHVNYLRYLLKCSVDIFIPIVVFDNTTEIKAIVENHIVVNRCDLISTIVQHKTSKLDKNTLDWMIKTIQQNNVTADPEALSRHKDNVHKQRNKSIDLINQGICPQCNGQIILRHGKFGPFYGCSNFPKCRFTINS